MNKQYHILNGDALKDRFPKSIQGGLIVARECLADGTVEGKEQEQFYASRIKFLNENYEITPTEYYEKTITEFDKINNIGDDSEINLWFEDDLFCQVNFWYISYILTRNNRNYTVYLIRPESHNEFGFGGLNESEMISIFSKRKVIVDLHKIANLWLFYQKNELEQLLTKAKELKRSYPFIFEAVQAHIDRWSDDENEARPKRVIKAIMDELQTNDFGIVFREFCKRESIYGFGDLHVKRLFDEIMKTIK